MLSFSVTQQTSPCFLYPDPVPDQALAWAQAPGRAPALDKDEETLPLLSSTCETSRSAQTPFLVWTGQLEGEQEGQHSAPTTITTTRYSLSKCLLYSTYCNQITQIFICSIYALDFTHTIIQPHILRKLDLIHSSKKSPTNPPFLSVAMFSLCS